MLPVLSVNVSSPCVWMWVEARAGGSWRRAVVLDLMAPGGVDRVLYHGRHSGTWGQTSLCWVCGDRHRSDIESCTPGNLQKRRFKGSNVSVPEPLVPLLWARPTEFIFPTITLFTVHLFQSQLCFFCVRAFENSHSNRNIEV